MTSLCIISGASAGIGAASAASFAKAGYRVINLSRRPASVDGVESLTCDLSVQEPFADVADTLRAAVKAADRTVLVHNAGLLINDTAATLDAEALRAVMQINVVAPAALNALLLDDMKPGSAVIFIGSTLSEKAVAGTASYVTSKHAVIGLMRATCQDLSGRGIHTACVCPGFTDTEMLRVHVPEDARASIAELSTFGRLVSPQEIADSIWFAAQTPAINGAVIHANLGQIER